ncbi:MAG TPA: hypothetical protein VJ761_12735 [Ktedonobacteraceae bacterium]|nr:hypothetical protein [Ktedonobacteraceae bacterium]
MNDHSMISDVEHLLGRIINSQGEPIDGHEALSSPARLPLYDVTTGETRAQGSPISLFEMGIKVIDLLAPVPRGGIIAMRSVPGVGKVVVQQEMLHNLTTRYDGYAVGIGMDESSYDASELMAPFEALPNKQKMVLVFEQMSDSPQVLQRLIRVGLTIAIELRTQGHEAMLVVDKNVIAKADSSILNALKRLTQEQGLITLFLTPEEEGVQHDAENDALKLLDTRIVFSRELAKQNIWPAIDRIASSSRLLEDELVSEEHRQVARQVRELLQNYASSPDAVAEDQQMGKRVQCLQQFLTQPFFVAEAFTDIPGEFVPLADTLRGCKELLERRYDDVPVEAFNFVGAIEQAIAKAKVQDR